MIRAAGYAGSPNTDSHAVLWCDGAAIDLGLLWTVNDGSNTTPTASLVPTSKVKIRVGCSVSVEASFTDPDNGPWSYVMDWGDGTTVTGSAAVAGIIPGISPHTYSTAPEVSARSSPSRMPRARPAARRKCG